MPLYTGCSEEDGDDDVRDDDDYEDDVDGDDNSQWSMERYKSNGTSNTLLSFRFQVVVTSAANKSVVATAVASAARTTSAAKCKMLKINNVAINNAVCFLDLLRTFTAILARPASYYACRKWSHVVQGDSRLGSRRRSWSNWISKLKRYLFYAGKILELCKFDKFD